MSANNREHILNNLEKAKTTWQERLAFLEKDRAITASSIQKFELQKRTEECRQEIDKITKEIASLKKENQQESLDILEHLSHKVHDITVIEKPIEIFGNSQGKEPTIDAAWQEFMRFWIVKLGQKGSQKKDLASINADDVILMLLSSHKTPREARALAVFTLECLAHEPELRDETVYMVFDRAIDYLYTLDGFNTTQNTLMDKALYQVMQSRLGKLCYGRMLQRYVQSYGEHRKVIGASLLLQTTNNKILNSENSAQILVPFLEKLTISRYVEERVDAALNLVEVFYRPQTQNANARIDFLPKGLLHKTISVLLAAAEEETEGNDAVSTAAIWAFLWLTSAYKCDSYTAYTFADAELDTLRRVILNGKRDAYARSWSALILSVCTHEKPVFAQADWIHEWAVVADGGKPQRDLPKVSYLNRPKDTVMIHHILVSANLPTKAREHAAIALGRLGHLVPEMVEPLLETFQDGLSSWKQRDEALVYLALMGGSQVTSALVQGMHRRKDDTDKYDLPGRCFLALIGMGDVGVLKQELELGTRHPIDINAIAYALAGAANPQGQKVLKSMKNHREKEVRNAVTNALSKSNQWGGNSKLFGII